MVQKEGKAAFLVRIKGAATLPDYFLSELRKRFGASSLQGRVQRADFARPYLEKINANILRDLLKTKVEDELGLEGRQLLRGSNKSTVQQTEGFQRRLTKRFKLEMNDIRLAIATLLAQPSLAGEVDNIEQLATLRQAGMPLLIELINQLRTEPNLNTAQLLERYRDRSEDSALNRLAMYEFPNPDNEADLLKRVFHDTLRQLRRKAREQRYDDLLRKPRDQLTSTELEEIQAYKGN
jgi:DNA primase